MFDYLKKAGVPRREPSSSTLPEDRLISIKQVTALTSFRRSTIYSWIKQGRFPMPHKVGTQSSRWSDFEVREWIAQQTKR